LKLSRIEQLIGIEVYATKTKGVGGVIRDSIPDFMVEEVLVDGSRAEIGKGIKKGVLGASPLKKPYLLCILVKSNWDTFISLRKIADQLGVGQKQIQIAGIKDAKAITAQHFTVENCSIEDLRKINIKDIKVYPIGYLYHAISPYYLLGNRFAVGIKAIMLSESNIEKRIITTVKALDEMGGIPNFFGHQRFGTIRPVTHLVGKAIVNGDFEKAAMHFLGEPSPREHPSSRKARKELQCERNFKKAFENFPKQLRYELLMLRHLAEKPEDFIGAFKRLPLMLQSLFVQAYQSYLFNRFMSDRIRRGYSLNEAEVGDFVVNLERTGLPFFRTAKTVSSGELVKVNKLIMAGKMQIALPIVGIRQRLSRGVMLELEKRILEEEGIEGKSFRIDAVPYLSRRGGLRGVVAPVNKFKLDSISPYGINAGENKAKLSFMLFRGSYATVFLREMMKPKDPIVAAF
jgi:tRNA pseudouridine13 synthase